MNVLRTYFTILKGFCFCCNLIKMKFSFDVDRTTSTHDEISNEISTQFQHYNNLSEVPWDIQKYNAVSIITRDIDLVPDTTTNVTISFLNMTKEYG